MSYLIITVPLGIFSIYLLIKTGVNMFDTPPQPPVELPLPQTSALNCTDKVPTICDTSFEKKEETSRSLFSTITTYLAYAIKVFLSLSANRDKHHKPPTPKEAPDPDQELPVKKEVEETFTYFAIDKKGDVTISKGKQSKKRRARGNLLIKEKLRTLTLDTLKKKATLFTLNFKSLPLDTESGEPNYSALYDANKELIRKFLTNHNQKKLRNLPSSHLFKVCYKGEHQLFFRDYINGNYLQLIQQEWKKNLIDKLPNAGLKEYLTNYYIHEKFTYHFKEHLYFELKNKNKNGNKK